MPNLKDLRSRIKSIKATQKITSAMKMVSAAKLRKAQENAFASRSYVQGVETLMQQMVAGESLEEAPLLLSGVSAQPAHLLLVLTSDRGLCGGFNSSIVKEARHQIENLELAGREVKILCLGRKGRDQLKRYHDDKILETIGDIGKEISPLECAKRVTQRVQNLLENREIGSVSCVHTLFKSALSQEVVYDQLVPFTKEASSEKSSDQEKSLDFAGYEFEPSQKGLLDTLVPRHFLAQIYRALLETIASEHGARMTAMDNATRNARDVIKQLELTYNRTRQAYITKELIEIISGAEAL